MSMNLDELIVALQQLKAKVPDFAPSVYVTATIPNANCWVHPENIHLVGRPDVGSIVVIEGRDGA